MKKLTLFALNIFTALAAFIPAVYAAEPSQTGIGMQPPASPQMERLTEFHNGLLMWIITGITLFVLGLMIWVAIRYNKKANPNPASFTHNVQIEILWTAIPVLILIIISVKSFSLLYYLDKAPEPDLTLKVSGYQWGWSYSYPDQEIEEYNSDMMTEDDFATYLPEDVVGRRLLEVYNPIVLPIEKNITFQVTAAPTDVIHSWAMPAFGVKKDAVPGRLNETWTRITKPGVYFGQCSEICGIKHAYMPITAYAVPEKEFNGWVDCMKGDAGANADYPARACVQKLGLDKYRNQFKSNNKDEELANATGVEE